MGRAGRARQQAASRPHRVAAGSRTSPTVRSRSPRLVSEVRASTPRPRPTHRNLPRRPATNGAGPGSAARTARGGTGVAVQPGDAERLGARHTGDLVLPAEADLVAGRRHCLLHPLVDPTARVGERPGRTAEQPGEKPRDSATSRLIESSAHWASIGWVSECNPISIPPSSSLRSSSMVSCRARGAGRSAVARSSSITARRRASMALLLAIGCGNVSILLLARGTARRHELAVRSAIGAGRRRIVRQLLTESLLLAVIGASLGVLASCGFLVGIKSLLPRYAFAPEVVIGINLPVLIFSVVVALATGVLFGLWPALQLSRSQIGQIMQSNVRRVAGSIRAHRTQSVLIAGQIALTLLLLSGAGSAMRSFTRLINTTLGYDPHNVMSVGIPLHGNSYTTWAARGAYFEQLRTKVAGTPGVTVAAISSNATPPRNGLRLRFEILGKPAIEEQTGAINMVSPSYLPRCVFQLFRGKRGAIRRIRTALALP